MAAPCRIRPASAADIPAVHEIERAVFADPWPRGDFRECLTAEEADVLVAELDTPARVAGYVVARTAVDEGEILNLAVAPDGRRRGVGRALVVAVLDALAKRGVREVFLEVRESNADARSLYVAHGFREVGRRPQYYRRPPEDAIILRAGITPPGPEA
ncbi:MAG: ribosomal protein S18-alanine N-acetyltransferase [Gemmatimonadales bacterium]|nr:ribosomal protein S18-alanine N-acetyltransferase [Gemmatimonadales bacterium]